MWPSASSLQAGGRAGGRCCVWPGLACRGWYTLRARRRGQPGGRRASDGLGRLHRRLARGEQPGRARGLVGAHPRGQPGDRCVCCCIPCCCSTSAARHLASSGVDVYTGEAQAARQAQAPPWQQRRVHLLCSFLPMPAWQHRQPCQQPWPAVRQQAHRPGLPPCLQWWRARWGRCTGRCMAAPTRRCCACCRQALRCAPAAAQHCTPFSLPCPACMRQPCAMPCRLLCCPPPEQNAAVPGPTLCSASAAWRMWAPSLRA